MKKFKHLKTFERLEEEIDDIKCPDCEGVGYDEYGIKCCERCEGEGRVQRPYDIPPD